MTTENKNLELVYEGLLQQLRAQMAGDSNKDQLEHLAKTLEEKIRENIISFKNDAYGLLPDWSKEFPQLHGILYAITDLTEDIHKIINGEILPDSDKKEGKFEEVKPPDELEKSEDEEEEAEEEEFEPEELESKKLKINKIVRSNGKNSEVPIGRYKVLGYSKKKYGHVNVTPVDFFDNPKKPKKVITARRNSFVESKNFENVYKQFKDVQVL